MSFPAYLNYKESGVEWLREVPAHWHVSLLKRGYEVVLGKMLQPEAKRENDELLPYLRAANIQPSGVDTFDVKTMWFSREEKKSLLLRHGDLLVSEGGDVGRSAIWSSDEECYFQNSINRIRSIAGNDTRFLYFWMSSIKKNGYVDVLCNKSTIAHFTAEKVAAVPLLIPDKNEQTQIARFLDHETARIDALIEEQQRLIELLKEKRQAVISHAVTKGLDPTVPMKDSGVEWLGEVPEHWIVAGLKWFWSVTDCKHITAEFVDDGIPLASIREVQGRYVALDNAKQTTEAFYQQFIEGGRGLVAGDLIFSRNATVGEVAQVADWHPPFAMGQDVCVLKKQYKWLSTDYLQAVLRSPVVLIQLDNLMIGSTFKRVNVEDIRGIIVPMPPQYEQKIIAEYLIQEAEGFDSLLAAAQNTITLLQERRSALISAAVTGKIDVRGWQPQVSAAKAEVQLQEAV